MSSLRTVLLTVLLSVSAPVSATALDDLTRSFAYCAGRYSAETEHAWLMRDPVADERAAKRAAFVALLEAVAPTEGSGDVLNYRISAKVAQAALLNAAAFSADEAMRLRFRRQAEAHLRTCRGFLLQG